MRFYEIDSGRILLDGADYRELTTGPGAQLLRHGAAGHLAVRGHDPRQHRLRAARARPTRRSSPPPRPRTSTISSAPCPAATDTVLDEDASNISSARRQLLTIARAFLADPRILILDEATSNVDTRTEVLIQEAMARLRRGRTSFVIAHRLSTIRNADTIVVMDDGRIVEQGSHARTAAPSRLLLRACTTASSPSRAPRPPDRRRGGCHDTAPAGGRHQRVRGRRGRRACHRADRGAHRIVGAARLHGAAAQPGAAAVAVHR